MSIHLRVLEWLDSYRPLDYQHQRFERLAKRLESPIEKIFWSCGYFELAKYGILTPQVQIGHYRVDFTYMVGKAQIIIELDGHDYHSQKEQMTSDYKRQRYLQRCGYYLILRFTGSEIYMDVQGCVAEVIKLVRGLQ